MITSVQKANETNNQGWVACWVQKFCIKMRLGLLRFQAIVAPSWSPEKVKHWWKVVNG